MKKVTDLPTLWSMMNNIKANKERLPKTFPTVHFDDTSRIFQDIDLVSLELQLYTGNPSEEAIHDINCLNHWLISKYGKYLWSKNYVKK